MTDKNLNWAKPLAHYDLGRGLTLWLPLAFLLVVLVPSAISTEWYMAYLHGELGFVENVQVAVLAAAVFAVLVILARPARLSKGLFLWSFLILLGLVYILGEEISWGQHYFGWSTPEEWAAINKQEETNLHNTSSFLNQRPRALLEVILFLLLVVYFVKPRFLPKLPQGFTWLVPTRDLLPTAALVVLSKVPDRMLDAGFDFGTLSAVRYSEIQEVYIYYAFVLYLLTLRRRINDAPAFRSRHLNAD